MPLKSFSNCVLVLAAVAALVFAGQRSAKANIYFDVQYASGGAPGSSTYDAVVTPTDDSITLNVYALITDGTPSTTKDLFKSIAGGFYVASSTLNGDIPNSLPTQNSYNNAGNSQLGNNFFTTFGGMGLGGTANSDISSTNWYEAITSKSPKYSTPGTASGGVALTLAGSTVGYEFPLGQLTVNFGAAGGVADGGTGSYTIPSQATTASFAALSGNVGGAGANSWIDSSGTHSAVVYTNAAVGNGGNGNMLYSALGAGLVFTTTGGAVTPPSGAAAITRGPDCGRYPDPQRQQCAPVWKRDEQRKQRLRCAELEFRGPWLVHHYPIFRE